MGLKATLPASTTIIFSDLLPWNLFKDYKWLWFVRMHFFLETYINIKHHVWLFPILFNCIVALLWSIYLVPNASFPLGLIGKSNRSIKHWLVSFEWSEARKSPMYCSCSAPYCPSSPSLSPTTTFKPPIRPLLASSVELDWL